MPTLSYYDQIWVYSELEAFKSGISKEDFAVISNLQRLDRISTLEKPEPIHLSFQNQIVTSENKDSINSDDSNTNGHVTPRGDKVTRSFLPHGVSSKAQLTYMISSINHLGAHIIGLDAVVKHVLYNVKDQLTTVSAYISSLQESHIALSQRLTTLEVNQATILEN